MEKTAPLFTVDVSGITITAFVEEAMPSAPANVSARRYPGSRHPAESRAVHFEGGPDVPPVSRKRPQSV